MNSLKLVPMLVRQLIVFDASFRVVARLVFDAELDNAFFDIEGSLQGRIEAVPTRGVVCN